MKPSILKEIWSLWEIEELNLQPPLSDQFKRLKIEMETYLVKYEKKLIQNRINHVNWLKNPVNKAKTIAYQRENKDKLKIKSLMKSREETHILRHYWINNVCECGAKRAQRTWQRKMCYTYDDFKTVVFVAPKCSRKPKDQTERKRLYCKAWHERKKKQMLETAFQECLA